MRYLLCVPVFCGGCGDVVYKWTNPGQDTEQGRAVEQWICIIQPTDDVWEALVRAEEREHKQQCSSEKIVSYRHFNIMKFK